MIQITAVNVVVFVEFILLVFLEVVFVIKNTTIVMEDQTMDAKFTSQMIRTTVDIVIEFVMIVLLVSLEDVFVMMDTEIVIDTKTMDVRSIFKTID